MGPWEVSCCLRTVEQLRLPIRYQLPVHRDIFALDQHLLGSHRYSGLAGRHRVEEVFSGSPPPPVQLPSCVLPHLPSSPADSAQAGGSAPWA